MQGCSGLAQLPRPGPPPRDVIFEQQRPGVVLVELLQAQCDHVVELQKGLPLVVRDEQLALARGDLLQELYEEVDVRRAVLVQHDLHKRDDDVFLCVQRGGGEREEKERE